MEVTVKRTLWLSGVLLVFGVAAQVQPKLLSKKLPESWVERALPTSLDGYRFLPSADNPNVSYKAGAFDYEALQPFGIVGRVFEAGARGYDAMVVVGNNRDSFHDPNFCLAGQYYNIFGEHVVQLKTRTRGAIPISVMRAEDKDGKRLVAFCYLGPHGFHPTQNTLYSDWFWTELKLGQPKLGAFFRFMTTTEGDSEENLLNFARTYLDAAEATSKGDL